MNFYFLVILILVIILIIFKKNIPGYDASISNERYQSMSFVQRILSASLIIIGFSIILLPFFALGIIKF